MRELYIGADLSFNSSGLCFTIVENNEPIYMNFELLLFDKKYKPLRGVTQNTYRMPRNITHETLNIDGLEDIYSEDQHYITLKYTIASKNLFDIIERYVDKHGEFDAINVAIEGFISPQLMGNMQFRSLTGLIMLQGQLRSWLISKHKTKLKLSIISPSNLKLFFTGTGSATKFDMLEAFLEQYDGEKLIDCSSIAKINDLVDAFALMLNIFYKKRNTIEYNQLTKPKTKLMVRKNKNNNLSLTKKKVKKPKKKVNDIIDFTQWLPENN